MTRLELERIRALQKELAESSAEVRENLALGDVDRAAKASQKQLELARKVTDRLALALQQPLF